MSRLHPPCERLDPIAAIDGALRARTNLSALAAPAWAALYGARLAELTPLAE